MPLTCGCNDDLEPGYLVCSDVSDFEPLRASKRKRCRSCKELINIGDFAVRFSIWKVPESEIEINIYGEDREVPQAPRYLCEKCGEIYYNLESVGFECIWPDENMRELLKEYQSVYKPPKLIIRKENNRPLA